MIYKPMYFDHNEQTSEKLNSKERKILDQYLRRKRPDEDITNWEYMKREWEKTNKNNQEVRKYQKEMTKQPDYTNIADYEKDTKSAK